MARFYGEKIKKKEINKKTGLPWKIDDVPVKWQFAVMEWLDEN